MSDCQNKRPIYPKYMTVTAEGKSLYSIWKRVKQDIEPGCIFADYQRFFRWAIDNDYKQGKMLRRYDRNKPYSPGNCTFDKPIYERYHTAEENEFIEKWNVTVNKIRIACGLDPFVFDSIEDDQYGN